MALQLGSGQILEIAEMTAEVTKKIKMIMELYDRPIIPEPMVTKVILIVQVENIWSITKPEKEP